MKVLVILLGLLSLGGLAMPQRTREGPYDIIVRDDKEPLIASFQSKTGSYSVQACGEYGFGSGGNAKIEALGCITQITFDFKWGGEQDVSYHQRNKYNETVTIKVGDILHGVFAVDTCAKTATGTIRDDTQNFDLMNLVDTNITDSKDSCDGPAPGK